MESSDLKNLISEFRNKGYNDDAILRLLKAAGYKDDEIKAHLAPSTAPSGAQNEVQTSVNNPAPQSNGTSDAQPFANRNPLNLKSFSQLFDEAWSLFKSKAWVLMGIYAIPLVASLVIFIIPKTSIAIVPLFILFLLEIILSAASTIAIIYAVSGGSGIVESYGKAFNIFWKYLWVGLLMALVVFGGLVMGIIPGLIFLVWVMFGYYILVFEDKKGINALLRSKEYVAGCWWKVLGRLLLLLLVLVGAGIIVNLSKFINVYLDVVLLFIFELVAGSVVVAFQFLLYKNLAEAKPQLASSPVAGNKRFFEFSAWLGLVGPILIAIVITVILNPSQLIKQARDAARMQDALSLSTAMSTWTSNTFPNPSAWKAGYYCSGGSGSFPGGGTCEVSESTSTDGTGWLPINFSSLPTGSPIPELPIDPANDQMLCMTSSPGGYCYYAVRLDPAPGQFQIYVPLETSKYQKENGAGNVGLPGWFIINNSTSTSVGGSAGF
ncbi:MAG: hypothetical protein M1153_00475 [Patescibacteria group bacterium]|nr:hypothetical protein [Patescibacteria group bacterium]